MGGEIFRTCPDRPWGPPNLLCNGYRVFPGGKQRPRRVADPSPPSNAFGHEIVQLYLYSPYGPYGLYRASVLIKVCTLPLALAKIIFVIFLCTVLSFVSVIMFNRSIASNLIIPSGTHEVSGARQATGCQNMPYFCFW